MVGLGSLSGGGVLIAGGGAGCTDCFQDDAKPVGASLLAILGISQISILTSTTPATHHPGTRELAPAGLRNSPKHFEAQKIRCLNLKQRILKPSATSQ
jgi:hypothetical protein